MSSTAGARHDNHTDEDDIGQHRARELILYTAAVGFSGPQYFCQPHLRFQLAYTTLLSASFELQWQIPSEELWIKHDHRLGAEKDIEFSTNRMMSNPVICCQNWNEERWITYTNKTTAVECRLFIDDNTGSLTAKLQVPGNSSSNSNSNKQMTMFYHISGCQLPPDIIDLLASFVPPGPTMDHLFDLMGIDQMGSAARTRTATRLTRQFNALRRYTTAHSPADFVFANCW